MIYLGNQPIAINHVVTQGALHPDDWLLWNIANLDYTHTDNGRKVTVQNNYIRQERTTAAGTTFGLYSLIGAQSFQSGSYNDSQQIAIYNAGGYVSGISLAADATLEYAVINGVADANEIQGFRFYLGSYDSTAGTLVGRRTETIASAGYLSGTLDLGTDFITAVNTNKNMMVNFQRRTNGTLGDVLQIRWKITGLGG